jgi:hypothetical protein
MLSADLGSLDTEGTENADNAFNFGNIENSGVGNKENVGA